MPWQLAEHVRLTFQTKWALIWRAVLAVSMSGLNQRNWMSNYGKPFQS